MKTNTPLQTLQEKKYAFDKLIGNSRVFSFCPFQFILACTIFIIVLFVFAVMGVMHQSIETPAPRALGHSGDLTRRKPGFNPLLTARKPRGAVHLTKCL